MSLNPTVKRAAPSKGRNRWTHEQRICLHLLRNHPRNPSPSERTRAFNHIYHDHLAACGVVGARLESKVLDCQYTEARYVHKPTWSATWRDVLEPPGTDEDTALRARLIAKIADVLQEGDDIDVAIAIPETPPETPRRPERTRKSTQNPYERYETPMDSPRTPTISRQQLSSASARAVVNPYPTPGPSTRKRSAASSSLLLADDDDELLGDDDEYVPMAKRVRRPSPRVIVPPSPQTLDIQVPQTPRRKPKGPREGATMLFTQPNGRELMLKPREYEQAILPMRDVSEEAAHPHPPALLCRYWHSKSHGINSSEGFVSGKYMPQNILVEPRGPPPCATIDMNDFAHHLNNTGTDQTGIPSPFISTANNLAWCVRMALKKRHLRANISIIDTSKLESKAIFYVPPFYGVLKEKRCFERGYFGYKGTHEHMVWHRIPRAAMVTTFSVEELVEFANSNRDVKRVLRLDQMAVAKTPASEIIKSLKQANLTVNDRVASAVGKIVLFLGMNHKSSREMLSRAVFEILQGWALKADGESQETSAAFVKVFQDKSAVGLRDHIKLQQAFLHGLQWSCGELNVHLKGPDAVAQMKDRASKRGMADPAAILINELDGLKLEVMHFEMSQRELYSGPQEDLAIGQERDSIVYE